MPLTDRSGHLKGYQSLRPDLQNVEYLPRYRSTGAIRLEASLHRLSKHFAAVDCNFNSFAQVQSFKSKILKMGGLNLEVFKVSHQPLHGGKICEAGLPNKTIDQLRA